MLIEWIQSKLTVASKTVRTIGFVDSTVALEARHKRCAKAWRPHLERCHMAILKNLPLNAKNILIVGSGPLLEIPIDELLKRNLHVTLMDVVHPSRPRKLAKKNPAQIELLEKDVTGVVDVIKSKNLEDVRNFKFRPPTVESLFADRKFDYVVSANLISQLSLDPYEVVKKYHWADDAYFVRLAKRMGDEHLEWLKSFRTNILVIADVERTYFDKHGQKADHTASAYRLSQGQLLETWDWEISPLGETSKDFCYIMSVEARIF